MFPLRPPSQDALSRFARTAHALRQWQAQKGAGLTIFPAAGVEPGATFALVLRLPVGYAAGRVRLGTPVSRVLQRRTAQSYLRAMRQVAERDPS